MRRALADITYETAPAVGPEHKNPRAPESLCPIGPPGSFSAALVVDT